MRSSKLLIVKLVTFFGLCFGDPTDNKQVSVRELTVDGAIEDLQWLDESSNTVIMKTSLGKLYRSVDSGRSWNEITTQLRGTGEIGGTLVETFSLSPASKKTMLVIGTSQHHFITNDGGMTFSRISHNDRMHSWTFHPTNPRMALYSGWNEACFTHVPGKKCKSTLYITRDGGGSSQVVITHVVQYSWGEKGRDQQDRIYFTHYHDEQIEQPRTSGWSKGIDFSVSYDGGKSFRTLVHQGNKFLISNNYVFVAKLNNEIEQSVKMLVCSDGTDMYHEARLPDDTLMQKSYTILDTSEDAIILHVNHGEGSQTGNIYISDASGRNFSLSLENNIRTQSGECEFDKIMSLEGVYMANIQASGDETLGSRNMFATDVEKKRRGKNENRVRTVISHDKGGIWDFIKAPVLDSHNNSIKCIEDCYLNLHGITNFNQYAPFYSVDNAIGLIMGTGNIGPYLRFEQDDVNTYLSRDGGHTWKEVHKGAYIYEFGDYGGLILMGDDTRLTKQVVFSWDEGNNWYDFDLTKSSLSIDNIVIEPKSSSIDFLLYGSRGNLGVIFHLDFTGLNQRDCVNLYTPDTPDSDYETWKPSSGEYTTQIPSNNFNYNNNNQCILGRELTYTRRKTTSTCFNGKDFSRPIVKKNCECTKSDYECDVGFKRTIGNDVCIGSGYTENPEPHECKNSSIYHKNPYRKVPGDSCIGGWSPQTVPLPCPMGTRVSKTGYYIILIISILVFFLLLINYLSKNKFFTNTFSNYGFDNFTNVGYSILSNNNNQDINLSSFSKYEPELGFIDSELDEREDDAPALISYSAEEEEEEEDNEKNNEINDKNRFFKTEEENRDDQKNRFFKPNPFPSSPVPRLNPPPGAATNNDDDGMELL